MAVIGGENTAVEEAFTCQIFAQSCSCTVNDYVLKRCFRQAILKEKDGNITIEWNHNLKEVVGDESGVTGIEIIR